MHYLIDTYNLLHAAAAMGGPTTGMTVRRLCQYLAASPASVKATLILDGRAKPDEPSPNEFPDIALTYSGTGVSADTVIEQIIELSQTRKKLTVVTNDRAVALHARRYFANATSCEQFLKLITQYTPASIDDPAHKSTGTRSPGESDHWMKEFGLQEGQDINPHPVEKKSDVDPLADIDIEDLLGPRD